MNILFQHGGGAPRLEVKVITEWIGEQNADVLGPWPGDSPHLH